jgi:hypothetical protein
MNRTALHLRTRRRHIVGQDLNAYAAKEKVERQIAQLEEIFFVHVTSEPRFLKFLNTLRSIAPNPPLRVRYSSIEE